MAAMPAITAVAMTPVSQIAASTRATLVQPREPPTSPSDPSRPPSPATTMIAIGSRSEAMTPQTSTCLTTRFIRGSPRAPVSLTDRWKQCAASDPPASRNRAENQAKNRAVEPWVWRAGVVAIGRKSLHSIV